MSETPRRRRSERYHTAAAQESPMPVPTPAAQPVRQPETPPPAMQRMRRPQPVPPVPEKPDKPKTPWWGWALLTAAALAVIGQYTAGWMLQAYLNQKEQERVRAHQQLIDRHPTGYTDWIRRYSEENNLQPAFVQAIILNESSYRADAVSSVGARGLMQLMPDTAKWIAGKLKDPQYAFENLFDAETNIRYGTWYLGYLAKLFGGDPVLVASAYHAGQGEVSRWLSDPAMSQDGRTLLIENMKEGPTKTYVGRVTKDYAIYHALANEQAAVAAAASDAAAAGAAGEGR